MLQYSVQLPPLSLSSKPKNRSTVVTREVRPGDQADSDPASYRSSPAHGSSTFPSSSLTNKRIDKRSAYAHSIPLAISTAFPPPSPSLLSSSLSSPSPSLPPTPSLPSASPALHSPLHSASPLGTPSLQSKPIPRSPFVPSALPLPVPGSHTRSPRPSKSIPLPSPSLSNPPVSALGAFSSIGSFPQSASSTHSSFSSSHANVLSPGDTVGEGLLLQGEVVRKVPILPSTPGQEREPAQTFEVVRLLGTGSYAVVYLVREVLYRASFSGSDDYGSDLDMSADGHSDEEDNGRVVRRGNEYGREYAIKLLSKANLDEDALSAQMFEATIHQSLPAHPNIVTLHRTLESPSFLLLLLEFVPGEDLFYFLEQARDHLEPSPAPTSSSPTSDGGCSASSSVSEGTARTPPTPSLLSNLSPSKLLSRTRLRLIASMFGQMCDAVAVCHERGVFHRDIKPENFIVTDGWSEVVGENGEMRKERRVVVKLTDFGLSTTDMHSADMDCGSAPYMSYECRNNLHPTYMPRAADVWSLGIVLINMLYHYNPWTDTTEGVCPSFSLFRQNPTHFFLTRFSGMTPAVADFLANQVFCILPNPDDDSPRVTARTFGTWIRELPALLSPPAPTRPQSSSGHVRSASFSVSLADVHGHRLSSIPHSRRPSLRSAAGSRNPSQRASWALSRAPSLGPAFEEQENVHPNAHTSVGVGLGILSPVPDQVIEEEHIELDQEQDADQEGDSRSASTQKRRKRGARKGKGVAGVSATTPDDTLETLASASQALAREISRKSRTSSIVGSAVGVPSPLSATTNVYNAINGDAPPPASEKAAPAPAPVPTITKKPSKWRLGFGKGSNNNSVAPAVPSVKEDVDIKQKSSTANNVASILNSLNASGLEPSESLSSSATAKSTSKSPYRHAPAAASNTSFASHAPSRYAQSQAPTSATSTTSVSSNSWRSGASGKSVASGAPVRDARLPPNVKMVFGEPWELSELPRQMYPDPENVKFSAPPARKRAKPKNSNLDTISERPQLVSSRIDASTSTTELDGGSAENEDGTPGSPRKVQKSQINALAKMLSALRR
ncbi:hypothetical protein EW026_g1511 [Hermanssonia centrifuga]|uniref:Protein kinase domain-containing protein n=1 Tax=Hermanssonia centrifuga TaxID=98765 RepID=A0A4S4KVT9_9APHY|nr:hypothetical protein EW026_g1511 [Hermanssonia centrifuga]